jgi:glycosyltransferase involved in cell wall biosynthesis
MTSLPYYISVDQVHVSGVGCTIATCDGTAFAADGFSISIDILSFFVPDKCEFSCVSHKISAGLNAFRFTLSRVGQSFFGATVASTSTINFEFLSVTTKFIVTFSLRDDSGKVIFVNKKIIDFVAKTRAAAEDGAIRIYAPTISPFDAIGNYCFSLYQFFSTQGRLVTLHANSITNSNIGNVGYVCELNRILGANDVIFFVYSTYDPWVNYFISLRNQKILSFHNVTPFFYYDGWDVLAKQLSEKAIAQIPLLESFDKFIANSEFTANCLISFFTKPRNVSILAPIVFKNITGRVPNKYSKRDILRVLVVGRVVPNKNIETAINIFVELLNFTRDAELIIVGSLGCLCYVSYLKDIVKSKGLEDGKVRFSGMVSDQELGILYDTSDVLLVPSLHEGFCVPVFEAMSRGILVCAGEQAAILEVLGGTGLSFSLESIEGYQSIANNIIQVVSDDNVYGAYVKAQAQRARQIEISSIKFLEGFNAEL